MASNTLKEDADNIIKAYKKLDPLKPGKYNKEDERSEK